MGKEYRRTSSESIQRAFLSGDKAIYNIYVYIYICTLKKIYGLLVACILFILLEFKYARACSYNKRY